MEAHILGSLVPSIEHLILIGDPLQLRPTLNNYCEPILNDWGGVIYEVLTANVALSMESKRGEIYKFDMSLMERLSVSGLPMSRIDVQRRMRPEISSLIRFGIVLLSPPSYYLISINIYRNTLYPGLEDHKLVKEYPDVRGIRQNVFFVSHNRRENEGGDDTASKYNLYEVCGDDLL